MSRRSLAGSLNPRQMWTVPALWEILCPLIAIPAVVAGPPFGRTSATGVRGNSPTVPPAGRFCIYRHAADVTVGNDIARKGSKWAPCAGPKSIRANVAAAKHLHHGRVTAGGERVTHVRHSAGAQTADQPVTFHHDQVILAQRPTVHNRSVVARSDEPEPLGGYGNHFVLPGAVIGLRSSWAMTARSGQKSAEECCYVAVARRWPRRSARATRVGRYPANAMVSADDFSRAWTKRSNPGLG